MLTCALSKNKSCRRKLRNNIPYNDTVSTESDEIQTMTLPVQATKCAPKFPTLNRINGCWSSNNNASETWDGKPSIKQKTIQNGPLTVKPSLNVVENYINKVSMVFIKNGQDKTFKLTFSTTNCCIIPLYTKERVYCGNENDKKVQPSSKTFFFEEYTPRLTRINTRRKAFRLKGTYPDQTSSMSFRRKVGFPLTTEPSPLKEPAGISATKNNLQRSVVYLNALNLNFKLHPEVMTLEFSRPFYPESLQNNIYRDLGLETQDQRKNKGSIIGKCNGDILKFTFNINDINYQQIPILMTRSCQIKDNSIYLRCISEITDKVVHVRLPRKIYNYRDPMIDIRRKNEYMKLHHIEPRWMYETRQNRLTNTKFCQQVDQAQKAYESTNGSTILYEGPGTLNKAREGLIPCEILERDEHRYEKWVMQSQNEALHQTFGEGDEYEKFDSVSGHQVPDWDLIIYTK